MYHHTSMTFIGIMSTKASCINCGVTSYCDTEYKDIYVIFYFHFIIYIHDILCITTTRMFVVWFDFMPINVTFVYQFLPMESEND